MTTDTEVTEFIEIDPDELHLVGQGANGFKALLAKSASEEVREVLETIAEVTDTIIVKAEDDVVASDEPAEATVDDVLAEINKTMDPDDDRPPCKLCKGKKMINGGKVKCPQCKGSGFKPMVGQTEKELLEAAAKEAGVAASGQPVPLPDKCSACGGTGSHQGKQCQACNGTGEMGTAPSDDELHRVDAGNGSITEGDPK